MMTTYFVEICSFPLLIHWWINNVNTQNMDNVKKCVHDEEHQSSHYYNDSITVTVVLTLVDGTFHYCIGLGVHTIYTQSYYVLTTASCLDHDYINYIQVYLNCLRNDKNPTNHEIFLEKDKRNVVKIARHPKYDKITHLADIALIRVDKPFDYCCAGLHTIPASKLLYSLNEYAFLTILWNFGQDEIKIQSERTTPYITHTQTLFHSSDQKECPPPKEPSETANIQKQFWYLFVCAKVEKNVPLEGSGAFLLECKQSRGGEQALVVGTFSYSYPLNDNEQVAIYTLVYWYLPWIYYIISNDRLRPRRDDDVFYGIYPNETTTSTNTKIPSNDTAFNDDDDSVYYSENTAYDNIPMGPNPNGAMTFPRLRMITAQIGLLSSVYKTFLL